MDTNLKETVFPSKMISFSFLLSTFLFSAIHPMEDTYDYDDGYEGSCESEEEAPKTTPGTKYKRNLIGIRLLEKQLKISNDIEKIDLFGTKWVTNELFRVLTDKGYNNLKELDLCECDITIEAAKAFAKAHDCIIRCGMRNENEDRFIISPDGNIKQEKPLTITFLDDEYTNIPVKPLRIPTQKKE